MSRYPDDITLQITNADRKAILETARKLGFSFLPNWPHSGPKAKLLDSADDTARLNPDVFFLVRDDWIFGRFVFNRIDGGYRMGTFCIQPRVNFCGIELYVPKQSTAKGVPRLAPGSMVLRDKPISGDTYVEGGTVPGVQEGYFSILDALSATFTFSRIGNEKVLMSRQSLLALQKGQIRPAFDRQDNLIVRSTSR